MLYPYPSSVNRKENTKDEKNLPNIKKGSVIKADELIKQ